MKTIGKAARGGETYPATNGGSFSSSGAVARNSAYGPATNVVLTSATPVEVFWTEIENGTPGVDVPLTLSAPGTVRILAMIGVANTSLTGSNPATFVVSAIIGDGFGPVVHASSQFVIDANESSAQITFSADVELPAVTNNISIRIAFTGNGAPPAAQINANSCSIDVELLSPVTG